MSATGDMFDESLPGWPMNNSLAKRNNLYAMDQVRACLLAAVLEYLRVTGPLL